MTCIHVCYIIACECNHSKLQFYVINFSSTTFVEGVLTGKINGKRLPPYKPNISSWSFNNKTVSVFSEIYRSHLVIV